jgi:hypothetical protein
MRGTKRENMLTTYFYLFLLLHNILSHISYHIYYVGNYPFNDGNQVRLFQKIARGHVEFRPKYWVTFPIPAEN